jgi:aspartate racemase
VEAQASHRADRPAVVGPQQVVTYGELNTRANAVARALMARGLRRGGHALVVLERGPQLAIVLLAVLKAGASYTWCEPGRGVTAPRGVSIAVGESGSHDQYLAIPIEPLLEPAVRACPNLPVLTRPSDVAIVMETAAGRVLVPHATVAASAPDRPLSYVRWPMSPESFDLWIGLMAGATLMVSDGIAAAA